MSTADFNGAEPPPINMPRVIPAPLITQSSAVTENHLASRVLLHVCYVTRDCFLQRVRIAHNAERCTS